MGAGDGVGAGDGAEAGDAAAGVAASSYQSKCVQADVAREKTNQRNGVSGRTHINMFISSIINSKWASERES